MESEKLFLAEVAEKHEGALREMAQEFGGTVRSGFLSKGEKRSFAVPVGTASVSGRVTSLNGRGIKGVFMSITDENGYLRTTLTNSFGYYRFYEVPAETSYQISARSKRYRFKPGSRSFDLMDNLLDFDFVSSN